MTNVVIIPSTGSSHLKTAVESVLKQTVKTSCYVICDGERYRQDVADQINKDGVSVCYLPRNVGADGYYGHRVYAAFPHLVDEDFVFFLDQDNWLAPTHVEDCTRLAEARSLQWVYSLRNVFHEDGRFICRDNCESLGKWAAYTNAHLIDTNAFCVRREFLVKICHVWHGKWGQDRVFGNMLMQHFPNFDCTGKYTVNYRLGGNPKSVTASFFERGNALMYARYGGSFPWAAE